MYTAESHSMTASAMYKCSQRFVKEWAICCRLGSANVETYTARSDGRMVSEMHVRFQRVSEERVSRRCSGSAHVEQKRFQAVFSGCFKLTTASHAKEQSLARARKVVSRVNDIDNFGSSRRSSNEIQNSKCAGSCSNSNFATRKDRACILPLRVTQECSSFCYGAAEAP